MPTYNYYCHVCKLDFRKVNIRDDFPVSDCPACGVSHKPKGVVPGYITKMSDKPARIKDGFQSGWNPALQCDVSDYGHYKRILKERGLEEMGKEKLPEPKKEDPYYNDKMFKMLHDQGVKLDGEQIKALKEGKVKSNSSTSCESEPC